MGRTSDFYRNLNDYSGQMGLIMPQAYDDFRRVGTGYESRLANMMNPGQYGASRDQMLRGVDTAYNNADDASNYIRSLNPGYTSGEADKMRYASMAPMAGAYGDAAEQTRNQALRTGQSAGLGATMGKFARQKGAAMSEASAATEGKIADARRNDEIAKANLMPMTSSMYAMPIGAGQAYMGQEMDMQKMSLDPMSQYGSMFGQASSDAGQALALREKKSEQENPWAKMFRTMMTNAAGQAGAKATK